MCRYGHGLIAKPLYDDARVACDGARGAVVACLAAAGAALAFSGEPTGDLNMDAMDFSVCDAGAAQRAWLRAHTPGVWGARGAAVFLCGWTRTLGGWALK